MQLLAAPITTVLLVKVLRSAMSCIYLALLERPSELECMACMASNNQKLRTCTLIGIAR